MINNELLQAGKICNIHGVKGYIKIFPWTDSPYVFDNFDVLFIDNKSYDIEDLKYHKNFVIVKLCGIDDADKANDFREKIVCCTRDDIGELEENCYFVADLIGCEILEDGIALGVVNDVINNGASDIYEIKMPDKTMFYLPAVKENIISVDIQNKIIDVKLPKGLLE